MTSVLATAADNVATPQIRNQGTLGGNVSQDTRCWYYRSGWPCYRAGGNVCYASAPTAMNREHAIMGQSRCVAVNPSDNTAFLRVVNTPRRDIGVASRGHVAQFAGAHHVSLFEAAADPHCRSALPPKSAQSLARFCDRLIATGDRGERADPIEAVRDLVDAIGYEDWLREQTDKPELLRRRLENVNELLDWLQRLHDDDPGQGLADLMGRLSLLTSLDTDKEPEEQVRLMTLHGSKGLEFPYVFMAGVEEDLLPHRNSLDEGGEEEERRLMYVGITRAQYALTLSFAKRRRRFGEVVACEPSRFLDELPAELLDWKGQDEEKDQQRTKERAAVHLERLKELFAE